MAESASTILARVSRAFGVSYKGDINITIAASDEHFRDLTEGSLPDWSAAVAMPGGRIILSPLAGQKLELEKIIAHEIVHLIIFDAAGNERIPRWFHEGCAELFSGEWGFRNELYLTWKITRGGAMTFSDIQNVFSTSPLDAGLAYDQSLAAIRYLVKRNNRVVLTRILDGLRERKTFDQSFLDATGYLPNQFEEEYLRYMRERYGPRRLIVLVPGTWTIIMALFLTVYLIKRRRSQRKLREWEREELREFNSVEESVIPVEFRAISFHDDIPEPESSMDYPEERPARILPYKPRPEKYGSDDDVDDDED